MLNHHFEILGLDKSVSISSSSSLAPTARRSPTATLSNRLPLSSLCLSDRQLQPPRFCSALTKHWTMCCFGFLQAWMFIIKQRLRANISSSSPHVVLGYFFSTLLWSAARLLHPRGRWSCITHSFDINSLPTVLFFLHIFWEGEGMPYPFFLTFYLTVSCFILFMCNLNLFRLLFCGSPHMQLDLYIFTTLHRIKLVVNCPTTPHTERKSFVQV